MGFVSTKLLSVIMPVYNESAGIGDVLDDIIAFVLDPVPGAELIVVDDCSSDHTAAIVAARAETDSRIRLLHNPTNLGHGPSVRRGIDAGNGEWVLHIDSDGQVDLTEFPTLWSARQHSDLVLGIRSHRQDPFHRRLLTRCTRLVVSALAGGRVRDANTPFKLFHRSLFEHLAPAIPGSVFAPSIMIVLGAYRSGATITEIETTHLARQHGQSTLRPARLARAVALSVVQTVLFQRQPIGTFARTPKHPGPRTQPVAFGSRDR